MYLTQASHSKIGTFCYVHSNIILKILTLMVNVGNRKKEGTRLTRDESSDSPRETGLEDSSQSDWCIYILHHSLGIPFVYSWSTERWYLGAGLCQDRLSRP